jgi:UDPglucose--hexose-1-phosphate uridylyltransferase
MTTEISQSFSAEVLGHAILSQAEIQTRLNSISSTLLNTRFKELERWSKAVGYFDHLREPNVYLTFEDSSLGVELRLQLNYSRLGYQKPNHPDLPKCPLCFENIGVLGKEKLRVLEFSLLGEQYFAHLTPFPLHPGHFVVNKRTHEPMNVGLRPLEIASEFIAQTEGFLLASNSDVEWAGASVLGHQHYQVFSSLILPIQQAQALTIIHSTGMTIEVLNWPCAAVRLIGNRDTVVRKGGEIIRRWKALAPGFATVNYLLSRTDEVFTLIMTLRHPDYRTQAPLTTLKAEGVGVIEMCGEAILPPRVDLSKEENIRFFQEHGLNVIREIILQNSPAPTGFNTQWLVDFLQSTDGPTYDNPFTTMAVK